MEPASLTSPALAGGFFTTSATWEAQREALPALESQLDHGVGGSWVKASYLPFSHLLLSYRWGGVCCSLLPLLLIVHTRGGGSLFGANPSQGQLGRQKVAALVSVPLRGQHAGCWTGRSWESSAWCSRDPASAHPTQDLGLCGLPAHAHMVSFPRSPSVWRDGSFDCQIQEGKAHKIHKCIVACVIFAQLQLTVTEMWALGPIFAVWLFIAQRGPDFQCGGSSQFHEWSKGAGISVKENACLVTHSCPSLCNPLNCSPPGSSVHGIFSGVNTGVGCRFLLQGIFQTQGSNLQLLCLLHCRWILLPAEPSGNL